MTTEPFDFDAWYDKTIGDQTIPLRLLGKVWDLPGDAPAAALLRIQRLEHFADTYTEGDPIPEDVDLDELSYEKLIRSLIGDTLVDAWLAEGIRIKMLQAVSGRLYRIYNGTQPADPGPVTEQVDDTSGVSDVSPEPTPAKPTKPRAAKPKKTAHGA